MLCVTCVTYPEKIDAWYHLLTYLLTYIHPEVDAMKAKLFLTYLLNY